MAVAAMTHRTQKLFFFKEGGGERRATPDVFAPRSSAPLPFATTTILLHGRRYQLIHGTRKADTLTAQVPFALNSRIVTTIPQNGRYRNVWHHRGRRAPGAAARPPTSAIPAAKTRPSAN